MTTPTAWVAPDAASQGGTVLGRLIAALRDKAGALDGQERPAAVLWPDPDGDWRSLVGALRERLPEFLMLGPYDEAARTGPAIWLRTAVDGESGAAASAAGRTPVLYLPAVSRQQLRAGDDCPAQLKPLVELLYRGAVWAHPNGREWTARAFLGSPKSLGLDVGDDAGTRRAMLQALPEVAVAPLGQLGGRRLDADYFRRMLSPDLARDVLRWLCEGAAMRSRLGPERWSAFRGRCRAELDFDPQTAPDVEAGERLGSGEGEWARVWERFLEAPQSYERVADVLLLSRPAGVLPFESERWPDLNAEAEEVLRLTLEELSGLSHDEVCRRVVQAEEEHGRRRYWVWSRLGLSPMAVVLAPLARLAAEARTTLGGAVPGEIARGYVEHGWVADAAAREALAAARAADRELVAAVVRRLLLPWLEDGAHAFQDAVEREALPGRGGQPPVEADDGMCLLFVDGLRYELARALAERLEGRGFGTDSRRRWAALPTLTAAGKPAATPAAADIVGKKLGGDFAPEFTATGRRTDARTLRTAIERLGYQVLGAGTLDAPLGAPARGWAEWGKIDALGHELDAGSFSRKLEDEVEDLGDRIARLLEVGWKAVRVVTDHGWLQMPGGLPKVDLPRHLTVSRGARCAAVAGESRPDALMASWHWNENESFVAARGVGAFRRSVEYAHGGLSIQECLVPDLVVHAAERREASARVRRITWRGFRCFVEASAETDGVSADLRLKDDQARSAAVSRKPLDADGASSLLLADDDHEHSRLVLVLVDDEGRILDRRETAVGEDS